MRKRNEASEKFDASREIHTNQTKVARHWPGRRANTLLSIATKSQPQSIRIRFNSWNNIKLIWYRINLSFLVEFIFDLLQSLMSFCIIDDFPMLDSTAVANGNTSERARSLKVHTRKWMWFIYLNARFICITLTALLQIVRNIQSGHRTVTKGILLILPFIQRPRGDIWCQIKPNGDCQWLCATQFAYQSDSYVPRISLT